MDQKFNLLEIDEKIQLMKKTAEELIVVAENFPSLYRNSRRIQASIKMLELNVSDVKDLVV